MGGKQTGDNRVINIKGAQIGTFGWPIGIVMDNNMDYAPYPTSEGIFAEISTGESGTYDFWALKRDGDFFLLCSLFEDYRGENSLFIDTRMNRVTEALLFCVRLYDGLGVRPDTEVTIAVGHGGLSGRHACYAKGRIFGRAYPPMSKEENSVAEITTPLSRIESHLTEYVESLTQPLFVLFDFLQISTSAYEEIVNGFVKGQIL